MGCGVYGTAGIRHINTTSAGGLEDYYFLVVVKNSKAPLIISIVEIFSQGLYSSGFEEQNIDKLGKIKYNYCQCSTRGKILFIFMHIGPTKK